MKRKILSILLTLVLVLSFSLVTAVPVGAIGATLEVSKWTEYAENPVFAPDKAYYPSVIKIDGTYYLYTSDGYKINYATSTDGISWTDQGETGISGNHPSVVYNGSEYILYVWGDSNGNPAIEIEYATSSDGINWSGLADVSMTLAGNASFCYDLVVRYEAGIYYGWMDTNFGTIQYATSTDGINWGTAQVTSWTGYTASFTRPFVYKDAQGYHMWVGYRAVDSEPDGYWNTGILKAYSTDGIDWETDATDKSAEAAVFDINDGQDWRVKRTYTPWVLEEGGTFKMWFTGKGAAYTIGYATADGPFPTIQAAINVADPGDTVNVATGTYREYLHITTDGLTIEGAGIDQSIIDLDGLIPYWHYPSNKSYASRAGVLISGYLSSGTLAEVVENVTFKGFTVKNAGLNPPITATGTHTGAENLTVLTDSTATWTPDDLIGQWVHNYGDRDTDYNPARSYGQITTNTLNTVTVASLSGGVENDWDNGDLYIITSYESFYDGWGDGQEDIPGIGIANGKNILIQYCKAENNGKYGISAGKARKTTLTQSENVTIDNCVAVDNDDNGISVGDHIGTVTITNNTCTNNGSPHTADPTREYQGTGIQVTGSSSSKVMSGTISGNTCRDSFIGIHMAKYSDGVTVEDNTVTGCNRDQDGAGIFFYYDNHPEQCQNHIIRNNIVTGNIRGIVAYYAQACLIEGNTITTDSGIFPEGQAAIKIDGGNNITVKDNIISSCDGAGIKVQQTWNGVDCHNNTFTGNTITGAQFAGVFISHGAHDNTFEYNTITGTTTLTRWAEKAYAETQGDGVFIWGYSEKEAGTGNVFHNNNIYGNAGDGMENQTATQVDAINNWWGDASGPYNETSNPDGLGNAASNNVKYSPWCASDDADPEVPGYQPPTPMIWGVSTDGTIQEAINTANPNDTITVAAGTYVEAVKIETPLTLQGEPGATIKPDNTTPTHDGARRCGIYFEAVDGVTIDGFEIDGTGGDVHSGICGVFSKDLTIRNNTIHDITNTIEAPAYDCGGVGITLWSCGSDKKITGCLIEGNTIYNTGRLGIFIGTMDSNCTNWLLSEDNVIRNNTVHHAYQGPTNDTMCGGICMDGALNCTIEGNTTYNIGTVEHLMPGIYMNGLAGSNLITGNDTYDNNIGILVWTTRTNVDFEGQTAAPPKVQFNNIYGNTSYGLKVIDTEPTYEVDATNNWWGTKDGVLIAEMVSNNVDYSPWLYHPHPAPSIATSAASSVTRTSATLNCNLNSLGSALSVAVSFEWGTTTAYGNIATVASLSEAGAFSATIGGLSPSTTYHFRAVAEGNGTSYGEDMSFTTARRPAGGGGIARRVPPGTTDVGGEISWEGVFEELVTAISEDELCTLTIPEGTVGLTEDLEPLDEITMVIMDEPPPPPEDAHVVGLAYDFGPDGATFDPPITLTFSYDPADIPVAEENLVLAYYDEDTGEWVELDCVVDTENNTITASVAHFTTFAIITVPVVAPPAPAAFTVSSLGVSPSELAPSEEVNISVLVANTGGESGSYTVVLKINGVKEAEKKVTVAAGESQDVSFSVAKEKAGSYSVDVDGLSASFTVVAPVLPPTPAPPEEEVVPVPEEVVPPEEEVVPVPAKPINWPVIGGVIGGVIVVGLLIFFLVKRRALIHPSG